MQICLSDEEVAALGEGRVLVRDEVLPASQVAAIRAAAERLRAQGALEPAGIGHAGRVKPDLRSDWTTWVADRGGAEPALVALWDWMDGLRRALVEATWVALPRFGLQLALYPGEGARYARHLDALPGDKNRVMTAILYLNPDWTPEQGGLLRAWEPQGPVELEPRGGRLVVFRSEAVPHEVLPAWAPRWAAAAWFRGTEAVPLLPDADALRGGRGE